MLLYWAYHSDGNTTIWWQRERNVFFLYSDMQTRGRILWRHKLVLSLRVGDHLSLVAPSNALTCVSSHQRQQNDGVKWKEGPETCGARGASGDGRGSCWVRRSPFSPHPSPFLSTFGAYHSLTRDEIKGLGMGKDQAPGRFFHFFFLMCRCKDTLFPGPPRLFECLLIVLTALFSKSAYLV